MKALFVIVFLCFIFVPSGFGKYAISRTVIPPCDCEVKYYKRKIIILPCITAFIKDSATKKPLIVGALDINGVIVEANKQGKAYVEVVSKYKRSRKYKIIAKSMFYWFCTKNLAVNEKDSIVCTFSMRRNREPLY